jgi:hypothetical protein
MAIRQVELDVLNTFITTFGTIDKLKTVNYGLCIETPAWLKSTVSAFTKLKQLVKRLFY